MGVMRMDCWFACGFSIGGGFGVGQRADVTFGGGFGFTSMDGMDGMVDTGFRRYDGLLGMTGCWVLWTAR